MVRLFSLVFMINLTTLASALAAGPFDGQWSGGSPAAHVGTRTCAPTTATVTVTNGKMKGKYEFGSTTPSIRGNIAPDGSLTGGSWGGSSTHWQICRQPFLRHLQFQPVRDGTTGQPRAG